MQKRVSLSWRLQILQRGQEVTPMEDIGRVGSRAGRVARLWLLVWPLTFVVAMTVLSECGPQMRDHKSQEYGTAVPAQPEARGIK